MASVYEEVREMFTSICDIEDKDISPSVNIIDDLAIDSIDFMDVTYEIDMKYGIKLPVEDWMVQINEKKATMADYFVFENLIGNIQKMIDRH